MLLWHTDVQNYYKKVRNKYFSSFFILIMYALLCVAHTAKAAAPHGR